MLIIPGMDSMPRIMQLAGGRLRSAQFFLPAHEESLHHWSRFGHQHRQRRSDGLAEPSRVAAWVRGLSAISEARRPVRVIGTIKDYVTDPPDPEDWLILRRYTIKREILRGSRRNSLYAYCAMLQAIDDARWRPADISNLDTGLYAASGGSPI